MATPLPPCPCGLTRDEAKLCINQQGICQALDDNDQPCGMKLKLHPDSGQPRAGKD